MNKKWENAFLNCITRENSDQEKEFLELLDTLPEDYFNYEIAQLLMKSFLAKEDYGVQERVISSLAGFDTIIRIRVLLEELPRLLKETPDWAAVLLGQEVDNNPNSIVDAARVCSPLILVALHKILSDVEFSNFYPNASQVKARLT
jgi:hypothetical protein